MRYTPFLLILTGIIIYPCNGLSILREIHVEWEYLYNESLTGFRLYNENALTCESTDPLASSMDCGVDLPDGESSFTLTAIHDDGTESPHSAPFSYIFSSSLKAIFSAAPLEGESPLFVTFDATSSAGNIVAYDWSFGDGETGSGNTVNHIFTSAGSYTVSLKTIDDTGAFDYEYATVAVTSPSATNTPPTAAISSSAGIGAAPLQVQFDGADSSDSDGTIISYNWDMGDGGTASGQNVTYTYAGAGSFNAKLTVTDDGGLTDSISTPIIVTESLGGDNIPPNAVISASTSRGYAPLTVSFDASNSIDPDGEISSYSWNFGDGTSSSSIAAQHRFSQAGVYTVTLRVTDDMGVTSQTARFTVTALKAGQEIESPPPGSLKTLPFIINLLLKNSQKDESAVQSE